MCFEKVPRIAIYIVKMGIWNSSRRYGFAPNLIFLMQKLVFHRFLKPYLRVQAHAYVQLMHASSCLCMQAGSFLWPLFSKNRFFFSR